MPNSDLLPSLLFKLNENQLAIRSSHHRAFKLVEAHGAADVAESIRGSLDTIDKNEEFIKMSLAVLMAPY